MIQGDPFDPRPVGGGDKSNPIFRGDAVARFPLADSLRGHIKGVR